MAGNYLRLIALSFVILFISCADEVTPEKTPTGAYSNGIYILNEGLYGDVKAATLDFYHPESNQIENGVFKSVNKDIGEDGLFLGASPQSMTKEGNLIHIIINGDGKILTINASTAEYLGKTTELNSPRYMVTTPDHRAYVTSLKENKVQIVNLVQKEFETGSIVGSIDTYNADTPQSVLDDPYSAPQHTTERIVAIGDELFTNAWSNDNKILVIDPNTNMLKDSIEVGIQPQSMAVDKNNKLWVLCDGSYPGSKYADTNGSIYRIDPKTHKVEWHYEFPSNTSKRNICINKAGDTLFFIDKDIYRMKITDTSPSRIIDAVEGQTFYALGIDPKNEDIYIGDAIDYFKPGKVYRYTIDLNKVDEFQVGPLPNSFLFNYN
ncbi:hypothetical protein K5X82_04525 [Halosquirtibacter xylanolyticus]|uniref:DUF5074 domain-containing protein n=1 Tax=Halosquirtibacter xylanolyticus TaxID=3374599 RepID=UPI0037487CDB|nr:hypothetical protein K5X82_04525 [Prolixibacteraceae bacterium]